MKSPERREHRWLEVSKDKSVLAAAAIEEIDAGSAVQAISAAATLEVSSPKPP
jgi:hypothetical protein